MKKRFPILGGIACLLVIILGVYFFTRESKAERLISQKNKLENAISLAEKKLNKEKETLGSLTEGLRSSFALGLSVQDQMRKSSDIVRQTDFMFDNPYGSNPQLIFKNLKDSVLVNNERKNINLMLLRWQQKINILSLEEIDIKESEKIRKEMEAIKSFIENVSEIINNLTPENSGLSQSEINDYVENFPFVENIDEVLVSIETAIETSKNPPANTAESEENEESNESEDDQDFQNPFPVTPPVIVTPDEVADQQEAVAQAEEEVEILEEKLKEVEEEIQESSPTPAEATDPPPITTDTGDANSENQDNNDNTDPYIPPPREITPSQGIIIQPGPPRLIQGTDPY